MLPITTTTMYGTRDAKFERAIVYENTIKVIITEEPTRALNYKAIYWGSPENGELETLYVGPDFDEGGNLRLNNWRRANVDVYLCPKLGRPIFGYED